MLGLHIARLASVDTLPRGVLTMISSHFIDAFEFIRRQDHEHRGSTLYLRINQVSGLLLLILLSPLMAAIAFAIWQQDRGSVCFAHHRVGRKGRIFKCLKFRSMALDGERRFKDLLATDPAARAEWERDQKLRHDPRVTPIGRFLRHTSLDELPQLVNVVRGEMLLIGPRPITVPELERYGQVRWHYLSVTPGMTGLWQVSGRNELSYDQRVALDRRYVETRSLLLDISILLKTLLVVLLRHGAR